MHSFRRVDRNHCAVAPTDLPSLAISRCQMRYFNVLAIMQLRHARGNQPQTPRYGSWLVAGRRVGASPTRRMRRLRSTWSG